MLKPSPKERPIIKPLLLCYDENRAAIEGFHKALLETLSSDHELKRLAHSFRSRIKDRDHLQDKLVRKLRESKEKNRQFRVTPKNLLTRINDIAGIRILHLHTAQAEDIDRRVQEILAHRQYSVMEGPEARTWDIEYEQVFKAMRFDTVVSKTLYTSVHYVIADQIGSSAKLTCELQVRTLTEEVWGEVDHLINYPHPTKSVPCHQQIRALARATSAAGRLVDSIFATLHAEKKANKKANKKSNKKANKKANKKVSKRAGSKQIKRKA